VGGVRASERLRAGPERPTWSRCPVSTSSAVAPTVSSIGTDHDLLPLAPAERVADQELVVALPVVVAGVEQRHACVEGLRIVAMLSSSPACP
jgi:hypothetical protein